MTTQAWDQALEFRMLRLFACGMNWTDAVIRARIEVEREHGKRPGPCPEES